MWRALLVRPLLLVLVYFVLLHFAGGDVTFVDWKVTKEYWPCGQTRSTACQNITVGLQCASNVGGQLAIYPGLYEACELVTDKCLAIFSAGNGTSFELYCDDSSKPGFLLHFSGGGCEISLAGFNLSSVVVSVSLFSFHGPLSVSVRDVFIQKSTALRFFDIKDACFLDMFRVMLSSSSCGERCIRMLLPASNPSFNVCVSECDFQDLKGQPFQLWGQSVANSSFFWHSNIARGIVAQGTTQPYAIDLQAATGVTIDVKDSVFESHNGLRGFSAAVLSFSESKLNFFGCIFAHNSVSASGGGITLAARDTYALATSFSNCTFRNNTSFGNYGGGGAFLAFGSGIMSGTSWFFVDNLFILNTATKGNGGGLLFQGGGCPLQSTEFHLLRNVFRQNFAGKSGGAAEISMQDMSQSVLLNMSLCNNEFFENEALLTSGALGLGMKSPYMTYPGATTVLIERNKWSGNRAKSCILYLRLPFEEQCREASFSALIREDSFMDNYAPGSAALCFFGVSVESVSLVVSGCSFRQSDGGGGLLFQTYYVLSKALPALVVERSNFEISGGGRGFTFMFFSNNLNRGDTPWSLELRVANSEFRVGSMTEVGQVVVNHVGYTHSLDFAFDSCSFVHNGSQSDALVDISISGNIAYSHISARNCCFANFGSEAAGNAFSLRADRLFFSDVQIFDCSFRGFSAAGGSGGAVLLDVEELNYGTVRIMGCGFDENWASDYGGAASIRGVFSHSSIHLVACNLLSNTARDGGSFSVDLLDSTTGSGSTAELVMENCTFSGNSATSCGGAVFLGGIGQATFYNCSFRDNQAGSAGGSLFSTGAEFVANATFATFRNSSAPSSAVMRFEGCASLFSISFSEVGSGTQIEVGCPLLYRDSFLSCPLGSECVMEFDDGSLSCPECGDGYYLLSYSDSSSPQRCHSCPNFATCATDTVVPLLGYWVNTYAGRSGQTLAQTLQCPEGYCNRESGEEDASCVSSRAGFLCGECAEHDDDGRELCQSMSVECVPCDECNPAWFFFLNVVFASIFVGSSLLFRSSSGAWKSLMYFFQMLPFVGLPLRRRSSNSESFAGSSVRALSSVTSLEFVRSSHVGTRCAFRGLSVPGVAFLGLVSPLFYFICFFCVFFVVWQGSVRVAFARWIVKTCFALLRRLVAPVFRRAMSGRSIGVTDADEYDEHGADGVDGAEGKGQGPRVEYVESSSRKQHDMAERLLGSGVVEDSSGVELAAVDEGVDDDGDDDYHAEESAVNDATLDSRAEEDDMVTDMDMESEMKTKLNQRAKPKETEKRRESASVSAEKKISMQRRIAISVAFWRWKWKWAYRFSMSFTVLILASYTTVAETTLRLLNCRRYTVDSEDNTELRLFEAGTFRCYQWWQYFLWIVAVCVVFPFPFYVFLYCKIVSLMYMPFGHRYGARQKAVLDVMQDSFRPGRKGWESVIIGRRLILILVASWTVDVYLRCLLICLFCLLFFGVHLRFSPFRSHRAQNFESLVLLLLAVISCLRMREAVLTSVGESTDDRALSTLFWLEVASAIIVVVFAAEYYVVGMVVKLVGIVKVVGCKLWRILLAVSRRVRPYVVQLLRTGPESPSEFADGTDGDGGRSGRVVEYVELEEA